MSVLNLNQAKANATEKDASAKKDGLGFADFLDIINPLHHLPVIGSVYRKLTGDTINPAMKIAGGALFGGPIGVALSAVELAFTSRDKPEPIDYGGVSAESVAGSYPLHQINDSEQADQNQFLLSPQPAVSTSSSKIEVILQPTLQTPEITSTKQTTAYRFSNGIPNPAHQLTVSTSKLVDNTKPENVETPDLHTLSMQEIYSRIKYGADNTKPLIDVFIGQQHPG